MFSIAVIQPNYFTFDNLEYLPDHSNVQDKNEKIRHVDIEKFKKSIENFVTIDNNVTADNINEKLLDYLGMRITMMGDTKNCHDTANTLHQLVYVPPSNDQERRGPNILATLLCLENEVVDGPAILISTYLDLESDDMYNINITYEDILTILMSKRIYTGVLLERRGGVKKVYYDNNKYILNQDTFKMDSSLDHILLSDKYKPVEYPLYKYNLTYYVDENNNDGLNENANRLFGKDDIQGDVLIIYRFTDEIYGDITTEDINKMLVIAPDNIEDTKLKEEEVKSRRDKMGRRVIISRHRILHNRYKKSWSKNVAHHVQSAI